MKRKYRIFISLLNLIILLLSPLKASSKIIEKPNTHDNNNINLVLDTLSYNEMPKNFRKTSDLSFIKNNKDLNISGLNKLNISGSKQFSGINLPLLISNINTTLPITIVDLRQESHGFINGLPISWANSDNSANKGLSRDAVLENEAQRLNSIKLDTPIVFFNHPNMTIIPTKVISEKNLVSSILLSYNRIPVTDGKIPENDMVDYFVDLVKSQHENTWIHFHCKAGVGRTTTFMIMYDMMKNSKEVTYDNIVKRQLSLARFNEKETKSFYNNERINFLKSFYKYCNENSNDFNLKWADWKKSSSNGVNFSATKSIYSDSYTYTKNPKIPTNLYVISQDIMSSSERTMISSLQGIVNNHSSSQIYTLDSAEPGYNVWLEDLGNNYGIHYKTISDPWKLIDIFKEYISGYILYNRKDAKDPSINNACTLASLNSSIVIDEKIQSKVRERGITKVNGDCRNTDINWAFDNLWNSGLNHSTVIQLSPDKDTALRDYSIMTKSLVFYEDSIYDTTFREKIFSSMDKDSTCFGWGPDEYINVSTASKYGLSMIAADYSYNLTVLSAFPSLPVKQKAKINIPSEKKAHYVTFIMSDGDNQQWNLGTNFTSPLWYGSPNRGSFNLGWSLSPSLYYLAPTVFNLYYKNAASGTSNDYFVVPPSGNGYIYPSKFDDTSLNLYINRLNEYMNETDEKYLSIIDDSSFYNTSLWDEFTEKPNIHGLFYLDYHKHNKFQGEILWSNNKPIVACRDLLWEGLEGEDELVRNINYRISSGYTDIRNPNSYTFVYVHSWSKNLNNIKTLITKLNNNSNVKIVTPETFIKLIADNIPH